MAKRKHQQEQLPRKFVQKIDARPILAAAKDQRDNALLYANHAQFSINLNEIFLDFYVIAPSVSDSTKPEAILVERVAIPLGLGKGFATGLANVIAGLEKDTGMTVPLNRTPDPDDDIVIWQQRSEEQKSEEPMPEEEEEKADDKDSQ